MDYVLSHSFSPSFMPIPVIKLTGYVVISEGGEPSLKHINTIFQAEMWLSTTRPELTFYAKQRAQKHQPRRELFRYAIN